MRMQTLGEAVKIQFAICWINADPLLLSTQNRCFLNQCCFRTSCGGCLKCYLLLQFRDWKNVRHGRNQHALKTV